MKFQSIIDRARPYHRSQAYKNPLYQEVLHLKHRFMECGLDETETKAWTSICLYLELVEGGCHLSGVEAVVRDLLAEFGDDTNFYQQWCHTKRRRNQQKLRIFHLARKLLAMKDWSAYSQRQRGQLAVFIRSIPTMIRYLQKSPLSVGLLRRLHIAEHIVGLWYDDLTQEENGIYLQPTGDDERSLNEGD